MSSARCEKRCELEIFLVARQYRDVGEDLVHAAVFAIQHRLHLRIAQRRGEIAERVREARQYSQRELVTRVQMRIAQPRENLVHRVPGDAEKLFPLHAVEQLLRAVGECADQSRLRCLLTRREFGDDVVDALPVSRVACRFEHQRTRRQEVTERMAVAANLDPRLLRFPTAVHRRLRREPRVRAEVVQQAIGFEPH